MSNIIEYDNKMFSTNYQKVIKYLVSNPIGEYTENEVQEATGISRAGVNFALRTLASDGLVELQKKGKMSLYSISLDNPVIRQIKVLINIIEIKPFIDSIKDACLKIILFGSSSKGTNIESSDIDIFVLTNMSSEVNKIFNKSLLSQKIQLIIKNPVEYASLKEKDAIFYEEISRGLLIWEKK